MREVRRERRTVVAEHDQREKTLFAEYLKRQERENELIRAVQATPVRDQWRQILVVLIAATIICGMFIFRTERFKNVMTKLEMSAENGSPTSLAALFKNSPKPKKPEGTEPAPGTPGEIAGDLKQSVTNRRKELDAAMYDDSVIGGDESTRDPASGPAKPVMVQVAAGISNHEEEEIGNAFNITVARHTDSYREVKTIPDAYAKERAEFPEKP